MKKNSCAIGGHAPSKYAHVKVKDQGQISSALKMHCNALAANSVTQQQTGPLRCCRG